MFKKFLKAILSISTRTVNIAAALLLLCAIGAFYINPDMIWLLGPLGLVFPFLLAVNILFVISWILRRRGFFLLSLVCILLAIPQIKSLFAIGRIFNPHKNEKPKITVMNYNVRCFDLYNWDENLNSKAKMYKAIRSANPDVLCFQEFYSDTSQGFNSINQLQKMGYPYYYLSKELVLKGTDMWAIAIFSKHPFIDTGKFLFQEKPTSFGWNPYKGIYGDIHIGDTTLRITTVHLSSVFFQEQDYDAIQDMKTDKKIDKKRSERIMAKLRDGFSNRGVQGVFLSSFLESSPHPVILSGDFNDTPSSFVYHCAGKHLSDAFVNGGLGFGFTYNGPIPFLRIDYIFSDKKLFTTHAYTIDEKSSDHKPVVASFTW
jgi:endonuclease/exonuclease/phosphatase (EEP) superfamily protein YafD